MADVDSGTLTVTVSVTSGTLSAVAFAGATLSNNGTGTVTISGTAAAINGALNGLAYNPTADYNGPATLTVSTSDGVAAPVVSTVALTVTSVADIANDTVTTNEDTAVTISVLGNDSFENAGRTITAVNGSAITAGGAAVAVANGSVTLNALGQLAFTPAADFSGPASFTYTVSAGGVTETATASVSVNAVNDAPVASGGQVNGTEDTNYVFSWANFNVSDVDTPVASLGVRIATLPADGVLQFSTNGTTWTAVTANQLISKATIDSGWLRFVPDANESGADGFGGSGTGNRQADYARFSYTPNDGSVNGVAATMRIDIAPDADTPTLSFGALVYTATSITSANATTTSNGFNMLAYNPNGSAGAISLRTGSPDGFGVAGAASGDSTELGYLAGVGSERLVVNFDNLVSSVDVSFAWLAAGERYSVQFLNAGTVVGGYTSSIGGTDAVDAVTTLKPASGAQFNQIVFSAPSPGVTDNDYLINKHRLRQSHQQRF